MSGNVSDELSASALLSIAVTLLSMGITYATQGNSLLGAVCVICGVALIYATIILIEKGIVKKMKKRR